MIRGLQKCGACGMLAQVIPADAAAPFTVPLKDGQATWLSITVEVAGTIEEERLWVKTTLPASLCTPEHEEDAKRIFGDLIYRAAVHEIERRNEVRT